MTTSLLFPSHGVGLQFSQNQSREPSQRKPARVVLLFEGEGCPGCSVGPDWMGI